MLANYLKSVSRRDIGIALVGGLLIGVLAWTAGFHYLQTVNAASLTSVSDTLSDSRPGFAANHTITFTEPSSTQAGQTIVYQFDPVGSAFGSVTSTNPTTDVTSTQMLIVTSCSAGANRVTMATTSYNTLTFTVCAGNQIATGTVTLQILNGKITNPTSTGSYIVRVNAATNNADTRVAIVNGVNVTAAVATTFTFTVTNIATGTTLGNGATTTGNDTSTTLPFGTISPNTHNELGQLLNVTTNASNGFAVTVHEDQDLLSSKGNTIHLFANGAPVATPQVWSSPSNTINNPLTYGHFGITSDDSSGTLNFGTTTPLYAGAFQSTTTLTVFNWNGPADGTTQNVGKASVGFRIEISPLQAAANDYTNNLIYVATPVF